MDNLNRDFTGGDHSFKKWFKIMWKNFYIQLVLIGIGIICAIIYHKEEFDTRDFYLSISVPIIMVTIVILKGFIQFWKDLKSGRSR